MLSSLNALWERTSLKLLKALSTTHHGMSTPSTFFPRFAELPFEIRLEIWELAIEPQVVHLRQRHISECHHAVHHVSSDRHVADRCTGRVPQDYQGYVCNEREEGMAKEFARMDRVRGRPYLYRMMGFDTDVPLPSLLLACHESFQVASKVYKKSFSALGSFAQTYFNFKLDTLYLDLHTEAAGIEAIVQDVLPYMCHDELAKVEKLSINRDLLAETMGSFENYLACILFFFSNVKTVYLISDSELVKEERQVARDSKGLSDGLILFESMETYRRVSPTKDCKDCAMAYKSRGIDLANVNIEIIEEKVQLEGSLICEDRGKRWPKPAFVYDQTITTTAVILRLNQLQRQCEADTKCNCYELDENKHFDVVRCKEGL